MDKLVGFIFLLFFVLSIRDVYQSFGQSKSSDQKSFNEPELNGFKKKIPESSLNKITTAPTITIKYWYV